MKRGIIVGGGVLEEDFALPFLQERLSSDEEICLIAADRGLLFLARHGIRPTHIVGDFDSADPAILENYRDDPRVWVRRLNPEKDWSDTEVAAGIALEQGCSRIELLGGTGGRIDHLLGNIQLLALIEDRGAEGFLLDTKNRLCLKSRDFTLEREEQWGKYVSLFAYGGDVTGLTLEGFKYQVEDFTLGTVGTRGVSNEITAPRARVSFRSGKLLVAETRD